MIRESILFRAVVAASLVACTPTALSPVAPVRPVSPVEPLIDLSPVPEPKGVGLTFRVRNPGRVITLGFGWLGLAISPEQVIPAFGKKPMPFDLGASLDVVVLVDEATSKTSYGLSLPIRSIDEMKEALGDAVTWRALPNGAFAIEIPATSKISGAREAFDGMQCAIAPSVGDAKARFVCAETPSFDAILPYLTRTLPRSPIDHDSTMEARPPLIRALANRPDTVATDVSDLVPDAKRLLSVLSSLSREATTFASAIHGVSASMDVDERGARFDLHLTAKRDASLLSQILMAKGSGPPGPFFALPPDSDFALFGTGTPRDLVDRVVGKGTPTHQDVMTKLAVSNETDERALDAALELASSPWVLGVSMGEPAGTNATGSKKVWVIAGVEAPFSRVQELARSFVQKKDKRAHSEEPAAPTLREVKAPARLPKDALAIDISQSIKTPVEASGRLPNKLEVVLHVLVASRGGFTWIAASLDDEAVSEVIARAVNTDPKAALANRPEVGWFRGPLTSGADLALKSTLDPALVATMLGTATKNVRMPPDSPLLISSELTPNTSNGDDVLTIRVDAPASISLGGFFALFKDAVRANLRD